MDEETFIGTMFFIVVFILFCVWASAAGKKDELERKERAAKFEEHLKKVVSQILDFTVTYKYYCNYVWLFDGKRKKACVYNLADESKIIFYYSQIKNVDLIKNNMINHKQEFISDMRIRLTLINGRAIEEVYINQTTEVKGIAMRSIIQNCNNFYNVLKSCYNTGNGPVMDLTKRYGCVKSFV